MRNHSNAKSFLETVLNILEKLREPAREFKAVVALQLAFALEIPDPYPKGRPQPELSQRFFMMRPPHSFGASRE
jgi:hypothetical protein